MGNVSSRTDQLLRKAEEAMAIEEQVGFAIVEEGLPPEVGFDPVSPAQDPGEEMGFSQATSPLSGPPSTDDLKAKPKQSEAQAKKQRELEKKNEEDKKKEEEEKRKKKEEEEKRK